MSATAKQDWYNGKTLLEALEFYSLAEKWNRVSILQTLIERCVDADADPLAGTDPQLEEYPPGVTRRNAISTWHRELAELQTEFCRLLQAGRLTAVGYRAPQLKEAKPEFLKADVWRSFKDDVDLLDAIDWESSALSAGKLKFTEIRVIETPRALLSSGIEPLRKRGRRKSRSIMEAAYKLACEEGKIDFDKSILGNLRVLQAIAYKIDPSWPKNNKGLKHSTWRKNIGNKFNRDRAAYKARKSKLSRRML